MKKIEKNIKQLMTIFLLYTYEKYIIIVIILIQRNIVRKIDI